MTTSSSFIFFIYVLTNVISFTGIRKQGGWQFSIALINYIYLKDKQKCVISYISSEHIAYF